MARLPQPGGDSGNWGEILNDYLSQSLKNDGRIKDNAITANALAPSSVITQSIADTTVTRSKLSLPLQNELDGYLDEAETDARVRTVGDGVYAPYSLTATKVNRGELFINVRDYGAKGDFVSRNYGSISAGSMTLSASGTPAFTAGDIGKSILVPGAGTGSLLPAIGTVVAAPSSTGGVLVAGTYYYKVCPQSVYGIALPSVEVSAVTVGANGSVVLSWSQVAGAISYRIYRSSAAETETYLDTAIGAAFTDTGASVPATGQYAPIPPTVNLSGPPLIATITAVTSGIQAILSIAATRAVNTVPLRYGTDDTIAIQAAIDAAGQRLIYFPNASYLISALTLVSSVKLWGVGSGSKPPGVSSASRLVSLSPTADALSITAAGTVMEDIALINLHGGPTAGAGIRYAGAHYGHLNRVLVSGFYDGIAIESNTYPTFTNSHILDPIRYGLTFSNAVEPDTGDQVVSGVTLSVVSSARNPLAAIHWSSGGGLRISDTKVNGNRKYAGRFRVGLDCVVADGIATSDIFVTGSSIENVTLRGVSFTQAAGATGTLANIIVSDNEFGADVCVDPIYVAATTANAIDRIEIKDNLILNGSHTACYFENVSNVLVGGNHIEGGPTLSAIYFKNCTRFLIESNQINTSPGIFVDTNCSRYTIGRQNGRGVILRDQSVGNLGNTPMGTVETEYTNVLPVLSSSYSTLVGFTPTSGLGGVVQATLSGFTSGGVSPGPFVAVTKRLLLRPSGGSVTATALDSDSNAGVSIDFEWNTTDVAGAIYIKARLNAASGATSARGTVTVKYLGPLAQLVLSSAT